MKNLPIKNLLTLIQKRFSSTSIDVSSSQLQDSSSFTVQYLINSCGLSSKSAISTSQKFTLDETKIQNSESVLKFLKSNGLDDTHVVKLVQKHPAILRSRVESNLIPKWEYFIQNGYTGKLLAELVVSNPDITKRNLCDHIKPSLEFLKELLGSNDSVLKAVTRCKWLLVDDLKITFKPNVDFMLKEEVPVSSIAELLLYPRALKLKPEKFARYFNAVKVLGHGPESPSLVHALKVMVQMSESTLSKKVEAFKSLGWTQEDKLETSFQNPELVLGFLKSIGLNDTHIAKLVQKHPAILLSRVERNLISNWEYLIQNGYTGKLLAELVVSNPRIIEKSLYDHIKPSFEVLKELLGSNNSVIKAVTRCKWLLTNDLKNSFKPNVDFMMKGGLPVSSINKFILCNPRDLMQKPEDFARNFNAVKELSLEPDAPSFVRALSVMAQMSESTLSKKVEVFKSLGWTQEDIVSMFRGSPTCLAYSEEKIRRAMDFFVNIAKVEREFIIAQPILISYGFDKMRRRYNILKVLESKKLLKWNNKVANLLTFKSEESFVKDYVDKYKTSIPGLEEMYHVVATREKLDS